MLPKGLRVLALPPEVHGGFHRPIPYRVRIFNTKHVQISVEVNLCVAYYLIYILKHPGISCGKEIRGLDGSGENTTD